jgi:hypothetical protein
MMLNTIIIGLAVLAMGAGQAAPQNEAEMLRQEVKLRLRAARTLSITGTLQRIDSKGTRISKQRKVFQKPNSFRETIWANDKAVFELAQVDGKSTQYDAEANTFERSDSSSAFDLPYGFDQFREDKGLKFDMHLLSDKPGRERFNGKDALAIEYREEYLRLPPEKRSIVRIYFDPITRLPVGAKKVYRNAQLSFVFTYSEVKIDEFVDPNTFLLAIPKGAHDISTQEGIEALLLSKGTPAPDFAVRATTYKLQKTSLQRLLKGKKALLLNFWGLG